MKLFLSGRILETSAKDWGLEEFVALACETGYDGINLRKNQVAQLQEPDTVDGLKRLLSETGLSICSVNPPKDRPMPMVVALATALRIPVIRANPTPEHLACLEADMRIGEQVHTGGEQETIAGTAAYIGRIKDPRAGVIMEPANLLLAGIHEWSEDMLCPLAGRLIGCHYQSLEVGAGDHALNLSDGTEVRYHRVTPSANAQMDLPLFVKALRKAGYDEFINVIVPEHEGIGLAELAADACSTLRKAAAQS